MAHSPGHHLTALDHVNIRTARVDALAAFYCDVLGLARGPRPSFSFGGAWLYCGEGAVVHLVEDASATRPPPAGDPPTLSHFAFRGTGLMNSPSAQLWITSIGGRTSIVKLYFFSI